MIAVYVKEPYTTVPPQFCSLLVKYLVWIRAEEACAPWITCTFPLMLSCCFQVPPFSFNFTGPSFQFEAWLSSHKLNKALCLPENYSTWQICLVITKETKVLFHPCQLCGDLPRFLKRLQLLTSLTKCSSCFFLVT